MHKIDCMIVGAEKAGTTSIVDYLAQHPEVSVPANSSSASTLKSTAGEYDVFLSAEKTREDIDADVDRSFTVGTQSATVRVAKSVNMLYSPDAILRLNAHNRNAKSIVAVRCPVARAKSSFDYQRFRGYEELDSLLQAVERELGGRTESLDLRYVEKGLYFSHLTRLDDILGMENVHIVVLERMRTDPQLEYQRICEFLSISSSFVPDFKARNRAKKARSDWLARKLAGTGAVKTIARKILGKAVREKMYFAIRRWNSKSMASGELTEREIARLRDCFVSDVSLLSARLDEDLVRRWPLMDTTGL